MAALAAGPVAPPFRICQRQIRSALASVPHSDYGENGLAFDRRPREVKPLLRSTAPISGRPRDQPFSSGTAAGARPDLSWLGLYQRDRSRAGDVAEAGCRQTMNGPTSVTGQMTLLTRGVIMDQHRSKSRVLEYHSS
jgi:hypothetical protein